MPFSVIPPGGVFGSNVQDLDLPSPALTRIQIEQDDYVFNVTSSTAVAADASLSFSAPQILGQRIRLIFTAAAPNTCLMDPSFDTYLRMSGPWQPTTDQTIEFISNGNIWMECSRTTPASTIGVWQNLVGLAAGWVNVDAQAMLLNGVVFLRGRYTNISGGPLTGPIAYLPTAAYYPTKPFVMTTSILTAGTTLSVGFLGMNVIDVGLVEVFSTVANNDDIIIGTTSFPIY
jgi:hypothetical protein